MQMGERYVEGTNFSVEEYKKPEYAVKVTAQTPRVLQGQPIKATIDARYYFGEPVANAKVKWVVHTSPYWPLGRSEDEDQAGAGGRRRRRRTITKRTSDYGGEQEQEKSGTLDADGKLQITIPTKVDSKKQDLVYRIEARVTDAGNREIAGHGYRARHLWQLLPDCRAELLRLQQGQHGDHQRHRAGLRQEAGADAVPRGDEPLGLAEAARDQSSPHRKARPTRAARRRSS